MVDIFAVVRKRNVFDILLCTTYFFTRVKDIASKSDIVVFVGGISPQLEGEVFGRGATIPKVSVVISASCVQSSKER